MNKTILAIVYFVFSAFILYFGIANMINGQGKLWVKILLVVIGIYFLYAALPPLSMPSRETR
jgi:hypothetical protein